MTINIQNKREEVFQTLKNLDASAQPLFGKMGPQHMIEHLGMAVSISTGSGPQKQFTTEDEAMAIKSKMIYSDAAMPEGIKNPILGDEPPTLKCKNMSEALEQLRLELNKFDDYYTQNVDSKMVHPRMGPLDHKEWIILHNKHFAHHFRQFNLL